MLTRKNRKQSGGDCGCAKMFGGYRKTKHRRSKRTTKRS